MSESFLIGETVSILSNMVIEKSLFNCAKLAVKLNTVSISPDASEDIKSGEFLAEIGSLENLRFLGNPCFSKNNLSSS